MLLATQCPQCHTTFKVASDQLKLQTVLVRCGVCQHVFNGTAHLTQPLLDTGEKVTAATDTSATGTHLITPERPENNPAVVMMMTEVAIPPASAESSNESANHLPAKPKSDISIASNDFLQSFSEAEIEAEVQKILDADLQAEIEANKLIPQPTTSSATPFPELIYSDAEVSDTDTDTDAENVSSALTPEPASDDIEFNLPASDVAVETTDSADPPAFTEQDTLNNVSPDEEIPEEAIDASAISQLSFIRKANTKKRLARWLMAGTLVFLILLAGQITFIFRDLIAASWPPGKKMLTELCLYAHCQIQLPAQLDALSYEANELHSLPRDNTFEFSLLLHNHSSLTQAWPHIELTLKNAQAAEQAKPQTAAAATLRRVFTPADYLANTRDIAAGFPANQEQTVKLYFEVSPFKATDYVVTVFYP